MQQQSQIQAQWEWKSNPNPFSHSEEAQWTAYSESDNEKLEEAYVNQQREVDLGDYIISIQDMLQKRKENIFKQRPIRRKIEEAEEDEDEVRGKRFFGAETPKTFNNAFGSLQDYLKFFKNRGPEIREFANLFNDIEAKNDISQLNEKILPCLFDCIKAESMKIPHKKSEKKLLPLFQEETTTMKQFYARVLKAYTIESFLYKNMNLYLRNEDWIQLHPLLPYAYCLCKAFFCSELVTKEQSEEGENMILYRGASFDEVTLSFYDQNIVKNFCWNAVTSTSRKSHIAKRFTYNNAGPNKPILVLFIIEVPLLNFEKDKTVKWIDIKHYSAVPHEDEVVLPPGSVFELLGVSRSSDDVAEIHLKLILDVEKLAYEGQIMHGALYSKMANKTCFKFACLGEKELSEAITHLKGNQVIEELEFCLCKFDEKVGINLAQALEKMPRTKRLVFISPSTGDKKMHWSIIFEHLEKIPIESLKIFENDIDSHDFFSLAEKIGNFTSLTALSLDFRGCLEITNNGLTRLCRKGLKYLIALKSLTLNFERCVQITDKGIMTLCSEGLSSLTSLTSLNLNFHYCTEITDEGLNAVTEQGLKNLTLLTELTLHFGSCGVTDKGLVNLSSQGLKYLTLLKSLSLHFDLCWHITNEGINSLCNQGVKNLGSLKKLSLYYDGCKITPEVNQKVQEFLSLYRKAPNEGFQKIRRAMFTRKMKNENSESKEEETKGAFTFSKKTTLKEYKQLIAENGTVAAQSIIINGSEFPTIKQLASLITEILHCVTSISSLTIGFGSNHHITDEAMKNLSSQVLKRLKSLKFLSLDFSFCKSITDDGVNNLFQHGLKNLISLESLLLDFSFCPKITDKGLEMMSTQGLNKLTSLTSLTLRFRSCRKITDRGFNYLSSQGIKNLTSLVFLKLNLKTCPGITDEGLNNLSTNVTKHLTSLELLAIDFSDCQKIKEVTWTNFQKVLKYLGYQQNA